MKIIFFYLISKKLGESKLNNVKYLLLSRKKFKISVNHIYKSRHPSFLIFFNYLMYDFQPLLFASSIQAIHSLKLR